MQHAAQPAPHSARSRPTRVCLSALVLGVMLALAACGGQGTARNGGAGTNTDSAASSHATPGSASASATGATSGNTPGASSSVDTTDSQVQSDMNSLNGLQSDADTDYSPQNNRTVP